MRKYTMIVQELSYRLDNNNVYSKSSYKNIWYSQWFVVIGGTTNTFWDKDGIHKLYVLFL